jgi:uncharacterized lipoprotein NlpE involved in copper resistance
MTSIKKLVFISAASLMFMACNHAEKHMEQIANEINEKTADTSKADSAVIAVTPVVTATNYFGILPCADCNGIETDISLKSDMTYSIHTIYQGRKSKGPGSNEFNETGTWMQHGADTIHLANRKDAPSMFIRTDSSLVQLDMKGKMITGKLAGKYILKKNS